jgi:hypothetical protein
MGTCRDRDLADPLAPEKHIIAPLCAGCIALPRLQVMSLALITLKATYRAKTGRRALPFHFATRR